MIKKLVIIIIIILFINYLYKSIIFKIDKFVVTTNESKVKYGIDCLKSINVCNKQEEKELYNKFLGRQNENDEMSGWDKIFEHAPNPKRNSAGPIFFNWIITKMDPTIKEFEAYNRFYCGVSGSVVSPCSRPDLVEIKETNTNQNICGYYYRCCWPCSCDIIKYAETELMEFNLKDGKKSYYVLTIKDPCEYDDKILNGVERKIPEEVTSFICGENRKIINGQFSNSGRLIFAILHDGKVCSENEINKVSKCLKKNKETCKDRLNTQPDDLIGGMGDIFVKLSLVSNIESFSNTKDIFLNREDIPYEMGDELFKECIDKLDKNGKINKLELIKLTHKYCANMRNDSLDRGSLTTNLIPIEDLNKKNGNKNFYISVCCTSDYCRMIYEKSHKYIKKKSEYYLVKMNKNGDNKIVQILFSKEEDKIINNKHITELSGDFTLDKLKEICNL